MKKTLCIFLLLTLPMTVWGIERVGTTSFQFLKIPVGVRGIGMGNAFVAGAVDASALYWNPSGIGWAAHRELLLTHINMPADIKYESIGIVLPFSSTFGVVGVTLNVLHMDDLVIRTPSRPEGTGELFTASDIAFGLTYSRKVSDRFTFGVQAKYLREELAGVVSQGVGFDAGLQYQTDFRSMRLGMVIQNFGPDTKFDGSYADLRTSSTTGGVAETRDYDSAPLPITFKTGVFADLETMFGLDFGEGIKGNIGGQFEHPGDRKSVV